MRLVVSGVVLTCALAAAPATAATTYTSSWEAQSAEAQKKGPYARVRGPDRSGGYTVSGPHRKDRPLWRYRWNPIISR